MSKLGSVMLPAIVIPALCGKRILSWKTAWVTRLTRETVSQEERRVGKKSEACVTVKCLGWATLLSSS